MAVTENIMGPIRKNTGFTLVLFGLAVLISGVIPSHFAQPAYGQARSVKVPPDKTIGQDWSGTELRFLTDTDFPPFNYYDEEGVLTGFNVDLARAICLELDVRCDIQTREWSELIPTLGRREVDAIIASLAINRANLEKVDFTTPYFQMSARFAARTDNEVAEATPQSLKGYKVGVRKETQHEAYLKTFFKGEDVTLILKPFYSKMEIVPFDTASAARNALKNKTIDFLFDDTVSLMFWLNGTSSAGCCVFKGGSYYAAHFFGEGMGVAVRKGNRPLIRVLNKALEKVRASGRYEELMLRYFPQRFY